MDYLKNNQTVLNGRLNNVCLAMKNVIVRQHNLIEELMTDLTNQNTINDQRVTVLETYVEQASN